MLHSLELELDDPELELSELKPVGLFRSTLSAMAATSERSFYKIKYSHFEIMPYLTFLEFNCVLFYLILSKRQKLRHNSHLENLIPLFRQLRSSSHCFVPHNWKIHNTTKVLGDSYCTVQIQDHVPPSPGHKHSLSRSLKNLQLSFIEKNF